MVQHRNTANPNVPLITRRNRQQAIYQSLKAIVSIKANKKAGFFIECCSFILKLMGKINFYLF